MYDLGFSAFAANMGIPLQRVSFLLRDRFLFLATYRFRCDSRMSSSHIACRHFNALGTRPGPERFENLFATILAYWYSAYKLKVGSALQYARGPVRMGMR